MSRDYERTSREVGHVYVMAGFVAGREVIPFRQNAAAIILRRLDEEFHFTDADARKWLDKHEDPESIRAWCRLAWHGVYEPRLSDTWERVFPVLLSRGAYGGTGAELAEEVGLGHGAVSSALSDWAEAGVAYRLRVTPP